MLKIIDFYRNGEKKKILAFSISLMLLFAAIFYIIFQNIVFSIFLTACAYFIFREVYSALDDKRQEMLHKELIEFAVNIIIMLRAGKSVRSIISDSVSWTNPPLKNYLKYLADTLHSGLSFNEAIDDFAKRCSSREARLISTALKINNKIGGDLVFILNNAVEALQESLKVRSVSRTITLQSRYSGNIIAFMPVAVLVILFFFMNSPIKEFFSSRTGNICLILGAVLETAGIFSISRILKR